MRRPGDAIPLLTDHPREERNHMKKLLVLLGLGGLAYYLVKDRLGGEPDEFVFTEVPPTEATAPDAAATDPAVTETTPEAPPSTPPPTV